MPKHTLQRTHLWQDHTAAVQSISGVCVRGKHASQTRKFFPAAAIGSRNPGRGRLSPQPSGPVWQCNRHSRANAEPVRLWLETLAKISSARQSRSRHQRNRLSHCISVAATAVVFTAVKAVLLNPLPYSRPSELLQLGTRFAAVGPSHIDRVLWNDAQEIIRRHEPSNRLACMGIPSSTLAADVRTRSALRPSCLCKFITHARCLTPAGA